MYRKCNVESCKEEIARANYTTHGKLPFANVAEI